MPTLRTTDGHDVQISARDRALVRAYSWYTVVVSGIRYVQAYAGTGRSDTRKIYMHRLVLGAKKGQTVDHKDRNGLHNNRRNLRLATKAQNNINSTKRRSASGFKGVKRNSTAKRTPSWVAELRVKGRMVHVGCYPTAEVAARAYDAMVRRVYGAFGNASLNFPTAKEKVRA